ncbi:MAG: hypothetical protein Q9220_002994 [cf. Caloplaca sp. 1 TL-2023]
MAKKKKIYISSPSESGSEGARTPSPPRRRRAGPPRRQPAYGRTSIPDTFPEDSDGYGDGAQDSPKAPAKKAKGKLAQRALTSTEPDAAGDDIGDIDDGMRQVLALSQREAQSTRPPELSFEEQLRLVMEQSMAEAGSAQASSSRKEEEDEEALRQIMEDSRREHEAQERIRAKRAKRQQDEEDELARVIRESQETAAEDFRKHAARMSSGGDTVQRTPSRTESNTDAGNSAPAATPATAMKPKERRKSFVRSVIGSPLRVSSLNKKTKPSSTTTTTTKPAALPPPSRTVVAIPVHLRKPPIEPPALIALCDAAFPADTATDLAIAASKNSASIYSVQQAPDDDYDPALAAALAASAQEATPALDITETGIDEPPPGYSASATDKLVNHMKFTTSDYRREKIGFRMRITPPIWNIMRLYRELMIYYATIQKLNGEDVAKDRWGKPIPLAIEPAPPTAAAASAVASTAEGSATELAVEDTNPTLQNSRPKLRDDTAPPQLTESATHFMANLPISARPLAKRMQDQSRLVSQSRVPGSRPRQRPEPHMRKLNNLPIMEEEEEGEDKGGRAVREEGVGERTRRRMQRDSGYRRSGI